ncbi:PREDICTED: transmembrane protein 65-like [Branchiostoma belcheri]|uniref:Transmembrane protein 65-like n=1 Tax=Branchiostoma belcheri TaxID=7741 RepID=A0A6P4ZPM1_BRABE|nr:PREDICTED: transmembrane protein 65-like [Branchiostoma belcheri]
MAAVMTRFSQAVTSTVVRSLCHDHILLRSGTAYLPAFVQHRTVYEYTLDKPEGAKEFVYTLRKMERQTLLLELQKFESQEGQGNPSIRPTSRQLWLVATHNILPFIGFGFLDNAVMLVAGDYIDVTIGTALGISTLAAAGLGNLLSDLFGLGAASYVEVLALKVGLPSPELTPQQLDMSSSKWASNLGRVFGVTVGCLLGMLPLYFLPRREKDEKDGDSQEAPTKTE